MSRFATIFEDPSYDDQGILDQDVDIQDIEYLEDLEDLLQPDEFDAST